MLMRHPPVTQAAEAAAPEAKTFTGNRALEMEEGLIFEIGRPEITGVDLDEPLPFKHRLGSLERQEPARLPGLSEPETMRHYVRLSRMNYAIDAGIYPLGSCTMKHNPRLNEAMARLPGFADIHPLQPQSSVQGALELIGELARWLMVMTGMDAVAMSPRCQRRSKSRPTWRSKTRPLCGVGVKQDAPRPPRRNGQDFAAGADVAFRKLW